MVLWQFQQKSLFYTVQYIQFLTCFFFLGRGGVGRRGRRNFTKMCRKFCRKFHQNFGKISWAQNFKFQTIQKNPKSCKKYYNFCKFLSFFKMHFRQILHCFVIFVAYFWCPYLIKKNQKNQMLLLYNILSQASK